MRRLIASQFLQWKELSIDPVATSGWDNRTFHLGKDKSVRLPSAPEYELQVEKEHQWLPKLAPKIVVFNIPEIRHTAATLLLIPGPVRFTRKI